MKVSKKTDLNAIMKEFKNNEYLSEEFLKRQDPTKITRSFRIGDQVEIGALNNAIIVGQLHSRGIYAVEHDWSDRQDQTPWRKVGIWPWFEIIPYKEQEHNLLNPKTREFSKEDTIRIQAQQADISSLLAKYHFSGIDMNPEYQRDYVWEEDDKIALIDSIFNNVSIGMIVLIQRGWTHPGEHFEVLDGKQRIQAIVDFYEDRLSYKGRVFSQMTWRDRKHFEDHTIQFGIVSDLSKKQIMEYFIRLNTFGKTMSQDHLDFIKIKLSKFDGEK